MNSIKSILYQNHFYGSILYILRIIQNARFWDKVKNRILNDSGWLTQLGCGRRFMVKQSSIRFFRTVIYCMMNVALLSACHRTASYDASTGEPEKLPSRVASAQDPGTRSTLKRLHKRGIKVVSIGQDYLISIPADTVFGDQSPRIRWESYGLLNDVVCYLKQFRKVGVDVTAYSSKYVSADRERALTSARAAAIADYLWDQDIDSRFIFTRGLGSEKPIFFNRAGGDSSPNARVEITFRNVVA